jgi:hypothetical protein
VVQAIWGALDLSSATDTDVIVISLIDTLDEIIARQNSQEALTDVACTYVLDNTSKPDILEKDLVDLTSDLFDRVLEFYSNSLTGVAS